MSIDDYVKLYQSYTSDDVTKVDNTSDITLIVIIIAAILILLLIL